jgi:hypothetical protein
LLWLKWPAFSDQLAFIIKSEVEQPADVNLYLFDEIGKMERPCPP